MTAQRGILSGHYAPGDRVGAILSFDSEAVRLLGYGRYVGDEIPLEAAGALAHVCVQTGRANPKFRLDSGETIFGCECWHASENTVKSLVDRMRARGRRIDPATVADARHEAGLRAESD